MTIICSLKIPLMNLILFILYVIENNQDCLFEPSHLPVSHLLEPRPLTGGLNTPPPAPSLDLTPRCPSEEGLLEGGLLRPASSPLARGWLWCPHRGR